MRLRPYIPEKDFEAVQTWVNDERVHAMWCANLINYPLEKSNFEEVLQKGKERLGEIPLIAETEEGQAAGLICYSLNQDTKTGMLRFVILDPALRGKGYGREMVSLAAQYGFEETGAEAVRLVVFSVNEAAKHCYLSAGFTEQNTTEGAFQFKDEAWGRCNMIKERK